MVVRGNTEERGWLLENVSSTTSCRIVYLKLLPPVVCQHGSVEEVDPWVDPDADTDSNVYRFRRTRAEFYFEPTRVEFHQMQLRCAAYVNMWRATRARPERRLLQMMEAACAWAAE